MDYKSLTISIAVTIAVAILANHVVSTRGFSGQKETEQMAEVKTINKHATTKTIKVREIKQFIYPCTSKLK